jgi:hypothetical protein
MAIQRDFKIDATSRKCDVCGRGFEAGEEYYSGVVETDEENRFARRDVCAACWDADPKTYFSYWKTRVPEPEEKGSRGPRLVDVDRLMRMFERLEEAEDADALRFRYVLALVLMRKRRFRLVSSRRLRGRRGEELTLREVGGDRRHAVVSPGLSEEEIRGVAGRLREILDMPEEWEQADANPS